MAKTSNRGLGALLLRIALAAYFIITGLCMLGVGGPAKQPQPWGITMRDTEGNLSPLSQVRTFYTMKGIPEQHLSKSPCHRLLS